MPTFRDIPPLNPGSPYMVTVGWSGIERFLQELDEDQGLELMPDFQRDHVWTEEQQIAYVEFILRQGEGASELKFNSTDFGRGDTQPIQLVDGLQRLTAVRRFLRNEIPAFGHFYNDFTDKLDRTRHNFLVRINDLPTREAVLQWYIDLNSGGTVHAPEEINRVKELLQAERDKTTTTEHDEPSEAEASASAPSGPKL